MDYQQIKSSSRDAIGWLSLDRTARRNAISMRMMEEIIHCLDHFAADDAVHVAIIRGEGRQFSAGWDRDELLVREGPAREQFIDVALRFYRALLRFPKPLIAAVEGYALGTAFDVVLLSDIRVCSTETRFAHPEVRLGGPCLYTPLKEVVGAGWARELVLGGGELNATLAEKIGFVTHVVAPGGVAEEAEKVARYLDGVPAETLRYTKSYLWTQPDPEAWLPAELDYIMRNDLTIKRK
jgi:enoyl-CoA hydratase/carnithine racemase